MDLPSIDGVTSGVFLGHYEAMSERKKSTGFTRLS
jgi:hypothetical protein